MNSYKRLASNSLIFLVANFGSKLISMVLVPFYSYVLLPAQYGVIDIVVTVISLVVPLVSFGVHEAIMRYTMKSDFSAQQVFTNGMIVMGMGGVLMIAVSAMVYAFGFYRDVIWFVCLIVILESYNCSIGQFCKGIDKIRVFAVSGIITTAVIAGCNILFLKYMDLGVNGYFLSMALAYAASAAYLTAASKAHRWFKLSGRSREIVRVMLKYSLPLMINSVMWWVLTSIDRFVIKGVLGIEWNGIYAVAVKLPTIIYTLNTIFSQAWQLSAIAESDSEEKHRFFTTVFRVLWVFMLLCSSGLMLIVKVLLNSVISSSYPDTWLYVPFLFVAGIFSSFSSFYGSNYVAMGKTAGSLRTTVIGAVFNLVFNVLFAKWFGLVGVTAATMLAYLLIWVLRIFDTRRFVTIKIDMFRFILSFAFLTVQIAALYLLDGALMYAVQSLMFVGIAAVNFDSVKDLFLKGKELILLKKAGTKK